MTFISLAVTFTDTRAIFSLGVCGKVVMNSKRLLVILDICNISVISGMVRLFYVWKELCLNLSNVSCHYIST